MIATIAEPFTEPFTEPFDVTTIPASPAVTESFNYTYSPFKRSTEEMLKRGIRCIPIPPQTKACKLSDWPELASCDPAQIASWRVSGGLRQNVGAVASPETVAILDIDDKSIMDTLPQPMPRTMTVRSNGGWHFYLRQTDATRELGNVTATEILEATIPAVKDEKGNIEIPAVPAVTRHFFDFQQDRKYVVAPWSIHPSGAMYSLVDDSPIIDCPDWLTQWIKEQQEKWAQQNAEMNAQSSPTIATDSASGNGGKLLMGGKVVWESEPTTPEQLEAWLDLHKETVQAPTQKKATGKKGATYQYIREDRCPWEGEHTKPNGEKDFAISIIVEGPEEGKTGVKCQHSHTKTWSDYKAFLIERTGHNFSIKTGEIISPSFDTAPGTSAQVIKDEADQGEEASGIVTLDMSDAVLDGALGEITQKRMFRSPMSFAWPSIVTVAGAMIKRHIDTTPGKVIIDNLPRTNLYLALIAGLGVGKSSAIDQAIAAFDIDEPALITGSAGSGEGLIEMLGDANGVGRLWNPDELSRTLAKANIEQSSLSHVLTSAFYKDKDANTVKGKMIYFNSRLSLIGGIVEEQFGTAFGNKSFGGLYDRFMFGLAPTGFKHNWYPLNYTKEKVTAKQVYVDNSVYDRIAEWKKQNPGVNPRVAEIVLRVAYIAACYSGKPILDAKDLDPAFVLAEYQKTARLILQPNGGETYSAKMVAAIKNILTRQNGKWVTESDLKDGVNVYRVAYGPRQYGEAIRDLLNDKAIQSSPGLSGKGLRYRVGGGL
jgi:hypothetical protein